MVIFKGNDHYPIYSKNFFKRCSSRVSPLWYLFLISKNMIQKRKKEKNMMQSSVVVKHIQPRYGYLVVFYVLFFVFVLPRKHCLSKITNCFLNCPINIWLLIWTWYLIIYQEPTSLTSPFFLNFSTLRISMKLHHLY